MEGHNMKNSMVLKYTVLFTVLILIFSSSCKKFLEEAPTGNQTVEQSFTTAAEGAALTIGPYRSLNKWTNGAGDYANNMPSTYEFPTGKAISEDAHGRIFAFQSNQISGDMLDDFNQPWRDWYDGVRDANFSISRLPGVTEMTEAQRKSSLGEVRTLRAWYYFNLVRHFGDVVMITETLSDIGSAQQPRTSLKTIYDKVIIPDLEFAVNQSGLPDIQSSNGRVTKHVARTLLADVYLTCAGYPYQEIATSPEKKWSTDGLWTQQGYPVNTSSAKTFLKKAQEQLNALYGKYTLGTYDDLHDPAKNNKGGAIFQAQYMDGVKNNPMPGLSLPGISNISVGGEYGTFVPTVGYFNSYNKADKRIQPRQMWFFSDNLAKKYDPNEGPASPFNQPYLYKFYDTQAIKVTGRSSLNWTFYRYADVLLMLTEVNWALRQLGEAVSENDLVKGINEVRALALLPAYRGSDLNLLNIMSERAYELVFENKMLWDQRRTRMCLVDGDGQFSIQNFIGHKPTDFSFSFTVMNLLSPISGREITTNLKCLQNFGYLPKQMGQ